MRPLKYKFRQKEVSVVFCVVLLCSVIQIVPLRAQSPYSTQRFWETPSLPAKDNTSPSTSAHDIYQELTYPNNAQVLLLADVSTGIIQLKLGSNFTNHRIILHLEYCNFDGNETLEISYSHGSTFWTCNSLPTAVVDNLTDVSIIPHFTKNTFPSHSSAFIVANLYQDLDHYSGDQCPNGWVSCNGYVDKYYCTEKCSGGNIQFGDVTDFPCDHNQCRCIPSALTCNHFSNCGTYHFEETGYLCQPKEMCGCGSLNPVVIFIVAIVWVAFIAITFVLYIWIRNSGSLLASVDIGVSIVLLIAWNLMAVYSSSIGQVFLVLGTIVQCVHLVLGIWLYIGNRKTGDFRSHLFFSLIYLVTNVFFLLVTMTTLVIYFASTADNTTPQDARLWVSGFACGFRFPTLFGVLHFIKTVHKRLLGI